MSKSKAKIRPQVQKMKEDKTVKLLYPIKIKQEDGTTLVIEEVTIFRIKLKHLRSLPKELLEKLTEEGGNVKLTVEEATPILKAVTTLNTDELINELDMDDFMTIQNVVDGKDFL
jgi:hypothetical protein